jgi:hypothetical protein
VGSRPGLFDLAARAKFGGWAALAVRLKPPSRRDRAICPVACFLVPIDRPRSLPRGVLRACGPTRPGTATSSSCRRSTRRSERDQSYCSRRRPLADRRWPPSLLRPPGLRRRRSGRRRSRRRPPTRHRRPAPELPTSRRSASTASSNRPSGYGLLRPLLSPPPPPSSTSPHTHHRSLRCVVLLPGRLRGVPAGGLRPRGAGQA